MKSLYSTGHFSDGEIGGELGGEERENHPKIEDPKESHEPEGGVVEGAVDVVKAEQGVAHEPEDARRVFAQLQINSSSASSKVVRLAGVSLDVLS